MLVIYYPVILSAQPAAESSTHDPALAKPLQSQPVPSSPSLDALSPQDLAGVPESSSGMPPASAPRPSEQTRNIPATGGTSPDSDAVSKGVTLKAEKISLDLKGVDILELFRILSLKMNLTIVPSKGVSGRVNIFLNNLSFEDALDVILISQDLACERKGAIINIMTSLEYEHLYGKKYNEKRKFKSFNLSYAKPQTIFNALGQLKSDIGKVIVDEASGTILLIDIPEKLELMEGIIKGLDRQPETAVYDIKYAKPADIKTHVANAITSGAGEVYVDERSSKVVVSDLPEKMKRIETIVKAFDEPSLEVFIEAEILQITLKNEYQRGINWEKLFQQHGLDGLDFTGKFPVDKALSFTPSPAIADAGLKTVVGTLAQDNYTTTLNFLQTVGDTKILSRPRIAVVNNQEARIMVGAREAYVTQTLSQGDTTTVTSENVQFIDVGVKLNVVPSINKDGFITMKIKPEVSSVRETLSTSLGSHIPIVETSESETVVKVKDGTMIMIAGLMKDDKREDVAGIPFLSKVPFLGAAFGSRAKLKKRTELIVFLRPHVITGAEPVLDAEPEKFIPSDIMPDDIKHKVIAERINKIRVESPQERLGPFETSKKQQLERYSADDMTPDIDIGTKIKGIKDF